MMFRRALTGVLLLITALTGHSQEQRSSREDYLDSKTVRWSDWVKSQPTSREQSASGKEGKSKFEGQDTGFLTPDEINYLVSDEPLDIPKSKRAKQLAVKKSASDDKRIVSAAKSEILESQPIQVVAPPPVAPIISSLEPTAETKFLFGAAATIFLFLQLVVVFLVWSLKSRLKKTTSNVTDIERNQSKANGPLQKQPDQDALQTIQMRNDEALRAERDKNHTLLLEIARLKATILQKSDAPLQEIESLKRQFVQEKNSLKDEIRDLQLRNDEFQRAAQEKSLDLLQENEQLKATIASMSAAPHPELESVQDQYLLDRKFPQVGILDVQLSDEDLLHAERAKSLKSEVKIDRLDVPFSIKATARSLIDETVLENILTASTSGFMER